MNAMVLAYFGGFLLNLALFIAAPAGSLGAMVQLVTAGVLLVLAVVNWKDRT